MSERGRKRVLRADLFKIDDDRKKANCLLCQAEVTSIRNFVFVRHYLAFHKEAAVEAGLAEDDREEPAKKIRKVAVRMSKEVYIKSLTNLVAAHGLPLRTLDAPAMRKLLDPYETAFDMPSINSRSIKPVLQEKADGIRDKIRNEVRGRMICLKLDIATRMDRDVLGINVQFIKKKVQVIRTLGMVELKRRHTARTIKEDVLRVLGLFGIGINFIYSITTDNGSNMLATSNLIELDLKEFLTEL